MIKNLSGWPWLWALESRISIKQCSKLLNLQMNNIIKVLWIHLVMAFPAADNLASIRGN